jgi:hypothetical protein
MRHAIIHALPYVPGIGSSRVRMRCTHALYSDSLPPEGSLPGYYGQRGLRIAATKSQPRAAQSAKP